MFDNSLSVNYANQCHTRDLRLALIRPDGWARRCDSERGSTLPFEPTFLCSDPYVLYDAHVLGSGRILRLRTFGGYGMLRGPLGLLQGRLRLAVAVVPLAVTVVMVAAVAFPGLAAASLASRLPQPDGSNSLSGVSCVSADDCWAVGSTLDTRTTNVGGETLHSDGSSWVAVSSPAAAGALDSVSCTSSNECWAVGNISNGQTVPRRLTARWNGTSWTNIQTPSVSGAVLRALSCSSSGNCWAVGSYDRSNKTLALLWTESRWIQVATPSPGKFDKALTAVTCISARNCWSFGYYDGPPRGAFVTGYLMAIHWNGSAWKRVWTSTPYYGGDVSTAAAVAGISCASSRQCLAVGWSWIPGVMTSSLALLWNGSTWATVNTPTIHDAHLYGVDCASVKDCWAVGSARSLGGSSHSPALRWNGSSWTTAAPPGDASSVSCTSSSRCWAVGSTEGNNGSLNLALRWNGRTWSPF